MKRKQNRSTRTEYMIGESVLMLSQNVLKPSVENLKISKNVYVEQNVSSLHLKFLGIFFLCCSHIKGEQLL
jgi:hypothetical protein